MNLSCRAGDCLRHQRRHQPSGFGLSGGFADVGMLLGIDFKQQFKCFDRFSTGLQGFQKFKYFLMRNEFAQFEI